MISKLLVSAALAIAGYGLWKLSALAYYILFSPLNKLRGPKSTSWVWGNLKDIIKADNSVLHEQWVEEHGKTLAYKTWFGTPRLFTTDKRALNHILTHSADYQKPEQVRYSLSRILGEGVLFVEGAQHKQQRRIMNPAFGPGQIRALTETFNVKSLQLRDILLNEAVKAASNTGADGNPASIDITVWLSRMTLDVIGLAGFNYDFDALNEEDRPSELNTAFNTMFQSSQQITLLGILQGWHPIFRYIPSDQSRKIANAQKTMARIGRKLLSDAKAVVRADVEKNRISASNEKTNAQDTAGISIEKSSLKGRDLLSLLVRANMATDLPDAQRLSDEDVLAQVPTFLVAGHETTSNSVTWALFALTQDEEVQRKLRAELRGLETENPTMDQLNALPYLDAVVRETLRVHAPVASTIRIATRDDIIPVEEGYVDRKGVRHDTIRVQKGDSMFIPILAMNRAKDIWGEDAHEFRPERWESPPEAAQQIPGVWANLMTFIGGPRACIGYRFSLVEMKAILFALVRAFEFDLAVPGEDIGKRSVIVARPFVKTDPGPNRQYRLPLIIRPHVPE